MLTPFRGYLYMNIYKRELRAGLKPFIFWSIGLFILVFAGMTKFMGIDASADSASITELMDKFPRVVLAMMGMAGVDVNTLGGYFSILAYYALICSSVYALHLGSSAVSRESVDKTYEFVFTKPRTRSYILLIKLLSGLSYLTVFCTFSFVFAVSAISVLGFSGNITYQILLFTITIFLISFMFFSLSAFISAATKRAEKGSFYGNLCFLVVFVIGIIYDMLENGGVLKFVAPLKYFTSQDLLEKKLDPIFVSICIVLTVVFLWSTFIKFRKKDLTAV